MIPQEIIRIKRDGGELSAPQLSSFIEGVTAGTVTEGQVAAFCMAVLFRGMGMDERVALTRAMSASGVKLDWDVSGPVLDKHSTGGVGDKTSLIIAPVVAACGGFVPMIAGRGLGHAGGTIDKLESIPGYQIQPGLDVFRRIVKDIGCAIIGQTAEIAPADRRIYAIRDTTATVESLDLITASILSKKLAAGLDALVMDVKFGSGAYLKKLDEAEALARSISNVANGAGVRTKALLTDMNQVLGHTVGNALEVRECVDWLKGSAPEPRLAEVTLALAAEMLLLGGLAESETSAREKCNKALSSGAAAECFARMVAALGGPSDFLDKPEACFAKTPVKRDIHAKSSGFVASMDVYEIGMAIVELGGGRTNPADKIDPAVGFSGFAQIGDKTDKPLFTVHARTDAEAERAANRVLKAIIVNESAPDFPLALQSPVQGAKPL